MEEEANKGITTVRSPYFVAIHLQIKASIFINPQKPQKAQPFLNLKFGFIFGGRKIDNKKRLDIAEM